MLLRKVLHALVPASALLLYAAGVLADMQPQWVAQFGASGDAHDQFRDLAVTAAGDVCLTGMDALGTAGDIVTVCFDADGNQRWVAQFDGPAGSQDVAQAMAVDANGDVYVVGRAQTVSSSSDYVTIKYRSSDGAELWARFHDGPSGSIDEARDVAVDADGNVYVTGQVIASGAGSDIETVKYDTQGNELWVVRYTGPGSPPFANDIGHAWPSIRPVTSSLPANQPASTASTTT